MAFRPLGKIAQFLHLWRAGERVVRKRQPSRIENLDLASNAFEQATNVKTKVAAIGYFPE
jgi:hypothetical protein